MAGRRSPWGSGGGPGDPKPGSDGDQPEPENPGDGESAGSGETPEPPAPKPKPDAAPKGPRNPWHQGDSAPPRRSANIEDIFRPKSGGPRNPGGPGGFGGGGSFPRLPTRPGGKSWLPLIGVAVAGTWLFFTSAHQLGSTEEGIVTTFGKYSHTIGNGVSLTMPWPIQDVRVEDVTSIKRNTIPEGEAENLMLTSDASLVDVSYLVRWNIKNLKLYSFQFDNPERTVTEVAEAAMRASIAEVPLRDAFGGTGRAQVEQNVRTRMQAILDAYRAGVQIQGVEIKNANPPEKVQGAFQKVTAAQQDAQRDISNAQAWAQQLTARAQGDAAQFDKVYAQYKLAPDVTRQRMYYETMERVLAANDKVIVEAGGVTSYLPLPEVRRKTAEPATPATGGQ
ncbi:MAG TPA: protease modulator HflK [Novosphingobium sp.]|nr:protease modulator HflK [Novosphingobium sp.]